MYFLHWEMYLDMVNSPASYIRVPEGNIFNPQNRKGFLKIQAKEMGLQTLAPKIKKNKLVATPL